MGTFSLVRSDDTSGTLYKVAVISATVGAETHHFQRMILADPTTPSQQVAIDSAGAITVSAGYNAPHVVSGYIFGTPAMSAFLAGGATISALPAGTYMVSGAGGVISALPAGTYTIAGAASAWPAGTYAVSGAASAWPAGTYPISGAASAWPAGTYAVSGAASAWPAGTYIISGTGGVISALPAGTYTVAGAASAWPAGTYAISGAASAWPAGTYMVSASQYNTAAVSGTVSGFAYGGNLVLSSQFPNLWLGCAAPSSVAFDLSTASAVVNLSAGFRTFIYGVLVTSNASGGWFRWVASAGSVTALTGYIPVDMLGGGYTRQITPPGALHVLSAGFDFAFQTSGTVVSALGGSISYWRAV